jgi:hypothetical protein
MKIALAGAGIAIAASTTMLAPLGDGARRALERPRPVVLRALAGCTARRYRTRQEFAKDLPRILQVVRRTLAVRAADGPLPHNGKSTSARPSASDNQGATT